MSLADRAYKYDKFYCRMCHSYYHICFDKKRDKLFFMCAECTGCLDEPVAEARYQENTFPMDGYTFEDYCEASLEQIQNAGLDLRHVFKRDREGEAEYVG